MQTIKTALIPAGGRGTRFLPSTKSVPKEMFPLGTKPVILHVVEECVASGIENIIFVVAHNKQPVEALFSNNVELVDYFRKIGKRKEAAELQKISSLASFSFVYTDLPEGNGTALHAAAHLLEDEPFVLTWSDEIIFAKKPRIKQCIEIFEQYGKPVISAVEITDPAKRSQYGMIEYEDVRKETTVKKIIRIVEKPAPGKEPSAYAAHGAYVLTPDIFKALEQTKRGKSKELWLTDILKQAMKTQDFYAKIIKNGHYLDCGNPLDYLFSQIDYYTNYTSYSKEVIKRLSCGVCRRK